MEYTREEQCSIHREYLMPTAILEATKVLSPEQLLTPKRMALTFRTDDCAELQGVGSALLLDFGKELCVGIRIITRYAPRGAQLRIRFGESVSEACTPLGEKGTGNDHAPRDIVVTVSGMSDLEFGQTGFRFVRIEPVGDIRVGVISVYAASVMQKFSREATITTNDALLNQIIETAAHTLKLNFQKGYIWDGIKRDRLVWCGDLHPEIVSSIYWFGNTPNIANSLSLLRESTSDDEWVNTIPSYSAWWVINLCDYCRLSGNREFFDDQKEYAQKILSKLDNCVDAAGNMDFGNVPGGMPFFLDWPTYQTPDALVGTACLILWAAKKFLSRECSVAADSLVKKLSRWLDAPVSGKQTKAFQVLAGGDCSNAADFLEHGGAASLSTFMAYYILTADALAGGKNMLSILKEYYGGMLAMGATSFWEDFDIQWMAGSSRIDAFPSPGQKDIHGDHGRFCYEGFRHSLCHGWSAGILAFFVETVLGIQLFNGEKTVAVSPVPFGLTDIDASIPVGDGYLNISFHSGKLAVSAPESITVIVSPPLL